MILKLSAEFPSTDYAELAASDLRKKLKTIVSLSILRNDLSDYANMYNTTNYFTNHNYNKVNITQKDVNRYYDHAGEACFIPVIPIAGGGFSNTFGSSAYPIGINTKLETYTETSLRLEVWLELYCDNSEKEKAENILRQRGGGKIRNVT